MIYLASPYSNPDPFIQETRYLQAMEYLAFYLRRGVWMYSPIVHCHELAKISDIPRDAAFWSPYCLYMLSLSNELRVLRLSGWRQSKGVQEEIAAAKARKLPITWDYARV